MQPSRPSPLVADEAARRSGPASGSPLRGRDPFIDALRGLCLFVMTANHFGAGPLHVLTWQPLGFVSAAEGFIFLSGLSTARALASPRADSSEGWRTRWARLRAWRVYRAHVATVAAVVALLPLTLILAPGGAQALAVPWTPLLDAPVRALLGSAALVYLPAPFDVLPLYVVFLAVAPRVLDELDRRGAARVLAVSMTLWLVSQLTLGRLVHWAVRPIPGADAPDFDVLGWQALFVVGLVCGWASARRLLTMRLKRAEWAAIWGAVIALFVVRHAAGDAGWAPMLAGRPTLGPLRALNFGLVALVAWRLWPGVKQRLSTAPLVVAGRHSLLVFCTQAGLLVLTAPFRSAIASGGPWAELVLAVAALGMVGTVAWLAERWRARRRRLIPNSVVEAESASLAPDRRRHDGSQRPPADTVEQRAVAGGEGSG